MLDEGVCGTVEELAKLERVNRGDMSQVPRLTLLAPDLVEAILDGRQPEGMRLEDLLEDFRWSGWSSANRWRSTTPQFSLSDEGACRRRSAL